MKIKTWKFLAKALWGLRLYPLWTRSWRRVLDSRYKHYRDQIPHYNTAEEAHRDLLGVLDYKPDPLGGQFDVMREPGWVEFNRRLAIKHGIMAQSYLDCDEFATWIAEALPRYNPKLMSVAFMKNDKPTGHLVALWDVMTDLPTATRAYYHGGNWGVRGPFPSLKAAIESITKGREFIYCGIITRSLKVVAHGDDFVKLGRDYRKYKE